MKFFLRLLLSLELAPLLVGAAIVASISALDWDYMRKLFVPSPGLEMKFLGPILFGIVLLSLALSTLILFNYRKIREHTKQTESARSVVLWLMLLAATGTAVFGYLLLVLSPAMVEMMENMKVLDG